MNDMKDLQTDYLSIPASILVPMLQAFDFNGKVSEAKEKLKGWDYKLEANSVAATIYVVWENQIKASAEERFIPEEGRGNNFRNSA